jgi:hypothetical protein
MKPFVTFATGERIVNILPALHFECTHAIFITSPTARKQNWATGPKAVLEKRGVTILEDIVLEEDESSRIDLLYQNLHARLNEFDALVLNLTGGLKPQGIALFEVGAQRSTNHPEDTLVYMEVKGQMNVYSFSDKEGISCVSEKIASTLTVEEILLAHDNVLIDSKHNRLQNAVKGAYETYSNAEVFYLFQTGIASIPPLSHAQILSKLEVCLQVKTIKQANNAQSIQHYLLDILSADDHFRCLLNFPKNRTLFFQFIANSAEIRPKKPAKTNSDIIEIQLLKNSLLEILLKIQDKFKSRNIGISLTENDLFKSGTYTPNEIFSKLCFGKDTKPGSAFETILFDWFFHYSSLSSMFVDIQINASFKHQNSQNTKDAECDLLLATKQGTLISLDAKTGIKTDGEVDKLAKKEFDARLSVLKSAAGRESIFILAVPFEKTMWAKYLFNKQLKSMANQFNKNCGGLPPLYDSSSSNDAGIPNIKELLINIS